ncbi:MAG: molybdopterin-dependent oxidoreductase [Chloroflexota bacterium]
MSKQISRRDFLKLAGLGAATTAVLTGCGPASRMVVREQYIRMPEYTFNGQSTHFATTCRECPAGCGLVVRTYQGRAIKAEGNPLNPVNLGKTCARGQATLQGLYNPDRVTDPLNQARGGALSANKVTWEAATGVVAEALNGGGVAFLMGMAPDHLYDLATDLGLETVRYSALGTFEARATLARAAEKMLGQKGMPFFDLGNADFVLSFGANFLETWVSPVAYTRGYAALRKGDRGRRGLFAQVEPRLSQTAAKADEWLPARPGTEGLVALAIGRIVAEARGLPIPPAFAGVEVEAAAAESDVPLETLERIASYFAAADRPLAIPGGAALAHSNGAQNAEAIFALNALVGNFGQPGGVFISPLAPGVDEYHRPANMQEMAGFVARMNSGEIKTLFIHGINPVFELPKALRFAEALAKVPQVISFATFPDETALMADYIFPDHHGLESWGYQRIATGSTRSALAGAQPVVVPFYNTLSSVDLLLAASGSAFADEVAYIQSKLAPLTADKNANFNAADINTFFAYFQQFGGWWSNAESLAAPAGGTQDVAVDAAEYEGEGEFYLLPYMSPVLGEAGANKPWLQEIPDPMTTVMWNSWLEINPETAHELGLENDDVVRVVSEFGTVEASVYRYPAIRPDTLALAFGQGHTAYGRYAGGRGANPADVLGLKYNEAGDLAFAATRVRLEKTGEKRVLSRLESKMGVYGEGLGEEH